MVTLDFKGPFQLLDFMNQNLGQCPGVYIWGFKGLIPNSPDTVVPYYVGITAESTISDTILGRHIPKICITTSTYMRLNSAYMSEFYKDSPNNGIQPFPIDWKSNKQGQMKWPNWNWPSDYIKNFDYYNNKFFISQKTGSLISKAKDYPISLIPNLLNSSNDYLTSEIKNNNFWIWYAEVDKKSADYITFKNNNNFQSSKRKSVDLKNFEVFESFVKHLLIGRTIGKHEGTSSNLASYQNYINVIGGNNNGNTIFKSLSQLNFWQSFPGNY